MAASSTASDVQTGYSGAATDPLSRHSRLRYVLILGGLTAFGPLSIDMYLPSLPTMANDLHSTETTLQLTLTAFIIGSAVAQIVIGPLSDAMGRRRPLLAGLALYAIGSVICALSPTAELLVAARVVQSVGAAAGIVIARAVVRDLFSGTAMTKFFSVLMVVSGLAPIVAPIVGGQVLRLASWHGVFVTLAVFGVLLLVTVLVWLPESLSAERRAPARLTSVLHAYRALLADRVFLGYGLAAGLMFAGLFAYISGSSFVLQGVYGLSPQVYSVAFGINGIGLVLAGQLNGRIVGRFTERTLLMAGLLAAAVGGLGALFAAAFHLGLVGLLIPLFILVSSIGLVMPNSASLALAEHEKSAGSASALLGVLQFVIGGVAAPLVGLGGRGTAIPMTSVVTGFSLLALLAFLTLARPRR